jgi:FkbM family methyltransferase
VRRSDRLIVDAGANIGAFTVYALMTAPQARVISIEPGPDSCDRIRRLLRAHGFEHRCTSHQAALGGQRGVTSLNMDAGSQFRATGAGGVQVDMVTLDEVVAGRVDLLKMDIEGAENTRLFRPLRSVPCEAFSASLWNIIPTTRFRPWPVRSNQPVLPSRLCARKAAATGWPTGRLARSRRGFNPRAQQPAPRGRLEPGRGAYCKRRGHEIGKPPPGSGEGAV